MVMSGDVSGAVGSRFVTYLLESLRKGVEMLHMITHSARVVGGGRGLTDPRAIL